MAHREELTLDEVFADPLIVALMKADRVDGAALRRSWSRIADRLRKPAAKTAPEDDRWRALVDDCICASRASRARARGLTDAL
ncbi:hypothetical protein NK718_18275 [Alsobacter sp. SYSU M60028]|uniref:Uncharacterized protein n=1 Tax=Alsobacter ponti TaxID=2962936 RepID=A0ABT1LHP7_9HYPH|nr:hypothetical protein [Alsobacter ponti]MCP8940476.1 hypothetical protein [Alsobacter ponti]